MNDRTNNPIFNSFTGYCILCMTSTDATVYITWSSLLLCTVCCYAAIVDGDILVVAHFQVLL
jgi:hypothetical protein